MKFSIFFFLSIFLFNTWTDKLDLYEQAKNLVVDSEEYADFNVKRKSYHVSEEVVLFSNFHHFFEKSDNLDNPCYSNNEIAFIDKDLLKINEKRCGKIKIFFSEQINNVFFAEVILYSNSRLKYSDRPIFGSSYIYKFTIVNDKVVLDKIKKLHYN